LLGLIASTTREILPTPGTIYPVAGMRLGN
jgi:hypothetical protein